LGVSRPAPVRREGKDRGEYVIRKILKFSASTAAILALVSVFLLPRTREAAAQKPALHVVASVGVRPAMTVILPQVEKSIGRPVTMEYDASKVLKDKILAGEAFDAVILTAPDVDTLIQQGKIAANTRADFCRTGIGIGIRAGAPKLDISTPEALKRTVLKAKSIALNPNGASTLYFKKALTQLGIEATVEPKFFIETDLDRFPVDITESKAEMLVALASEIMSLKGIDYAGPLPGDLQTYVNFVTGVSANTPNTDAGKMFVKSITSPANAPLLKAKGLETR
jgi:molybdate transport system substrate-binding protein